MKGDFPLHLQNRGSFQNIGGRAIWNMEAHKHLYLCLLTLLLCKDKFLANSISCLIRIHNVGMFDFTERKVVFGLCILVGSWDPVYSGSTDNVKFGYSQFIG